MSHPVLTSSPRPGTSRRTLTTATWLRAGGQFISSVAFCTRARENAWLLAGLFTFLSFALPARAQWTTQNFQLRRGWNAVYLHVDATHATLGQLVGSGTDVTTPIEEVWRWNPLPSPDQFVPSPQAPADTEGSRWKSWERGDEASFRLAGNVAYLVFASEPFTWSLKGRPILPAYRWSTSGLNFFGFPTVLVNPPSFDQFMGAVASLQYSRIYRYNDAELGLGNPVELTAIESNLVTRSEAFWIDAGAAYNQYFGPFTVISSAGDGLHFRDNLGTLAFRVRNNTTAPLTVSMRLINSEAAPAGETPISGVPPLLVRGSLITSNLNYTHSRLAANTPHSWNLAPRETPGAEVEVVLGLDRAAITAATGTLLAGVLQLTDSLGHTQVDVGVSATPASSAGLWVGTAAVTEVGQYLRSYLRNPTNSNALVINTNGQYIVAETITNLTPVTAPYPLRLIVHNPANAPATLLQRVYYGFNAATNPIVATQESVLLRSRLADSRRLSAAHLPWTAANRGWTFSGPLGQGLVLTTSITNLFNDQAANPFLHSYHPDHDNLDDRFNSELPQGSESFTIEREISLEVRPPADDFESRTSASLTLRGTYLETLRLKGLARGGTVDTRRFDATGEFQLSRVLEIPALTRPP